MGLINTFEKTLKTNQALPAWIDVHRRPVRRRSQRSRTKIDTVTVGGLLNKLKPTPRRSLLLGQCADELPFLIELGDAELGAILVSCEKGGGKTHQLQVMVDSAIILNKPNQLQVAILTFKPDEWQTWQNSPKRHKHLQGVYAWHDPYAECLLQNLVELAEARRDAEKPGADVLLILDDLYFIEALSYEAQVNLHWLLEYGSQSSIWLIGAINAHQVRDFRYWVDPFRTRIVGQVKRLENHEILSMKKGSGTETFEPAMFRTWLGNGWRTYRLPLLGH